MAVQTQFQFRRGTAAQWTSANPTLAAGEMGFETDTGFAKIGNGSTAWNSLSYSIQGGDISGVTAGTGLSGGGSSGSVTLSIDTTTTADLSTAQTLTNKTLTNVVYTQALVTPTFSTNAYTLALTDQGDILLASNGATAGTITIPTNSTTAFPTGTQITIIQTGAGQLTVQGAGGVTVNSTGATATAPKLRVQNSSATCIKTATNTWYVVGDIA